MATADELRRELAKAEKELEDAKAALKEFNEGEDGQWLAELKRKLRKEEGTKAQRAEWKEERTQLEERQKSLEAEVTKWSDEVLKSREDLRRAQAQTGNDFVTRALGTLNSVG